MAGTDLTIYIGADASAFIKGMDAALNSVSGKEGSGSFAKLLKKGLEGGISGLISGIGAAFGPEGELVATAINMVTEAIGKMIERAKELRNLSYATGLTASELSSLETYAESTGISLHTLAGAFYEFNKRMATAQIRGSEFNMAAAKLGLDVEKLKNRTLGAADAMRALAMAHKAGTDDATLAYYGNILLGSSYEQLLPAIKRGTADMTAFGDVTVGVTNQATSTFARLGDMISLFWTNIKNATYSATGEIFGKWENWLDSINIAVVSAFARSNPQGAARGLNAVMSGASDERKAFVASMVSGTLNEEKGKKFIDAFNKILGEGGKKVEPFGLATARGASNLQQMGGGDIVSAIAFTPLERIATATEETAKNTARKEPENFTEQQSLKTVPLGF